LRRPSLGFALAVNRAVREPDEWFEEPDDLERVQRVIKAIEAIDDPVKAAAIIACRVARAQGFAEGNKRTGLLLARWILDRNGVEGATLLPPDDREFADLLVKAASGLDVEDQAVALLQRRRLGNA
jgi:prophage maintenance system killer protein